MKFWRKQTKIFAFFYLLFASLILTQAQTVDDNSNIYELPKGTKIQVKMDNEINSKVSSVDDTFTTVISEPVVVDETVVIPIGTIVEGRVLKVTPAAVGGKNGKLEIKFETLKFSGGEKRDIEAILVNELEAKSSQTTKTLTILGGIALGGISGTVTKADNGALIGAGIGAGAGTGVALLRKGSDVRIKSDEKFEIELTKKVTVPVRDF
jgi:hypothetical protein